ncbi:transcriptional regulator, TetR family [Agromyces sp. CF514]|uniref:TetR/AcrR family transcriptional regulator n=1 Tax=Agromyces sp. CF514 TaxID=1881031 RepID=UPI0008ECBDAA|nr:TetR family transcriptional regulator C-terminal domain-containing protein [Agromyces sp. CF514]SFR68376.1 transcriptional regulator, TetR family [Agromyces sp. CF514]
MPRPNRRAERRLAILEAARDVAVREGAEGTTLRAIATACGMEPSAVLYYFDGLGDLVRELVYAASDRFIETIRSAVAGASDPVDRLVAAIEAGSTGGLAGDESRILYEFWSLGLRDPLLNDADHALDRRQVEIYREIIDEGVGTGAFRPRLDVDRVAWALVALEDGLVMDILAGTKTRDEVTALIRSVASAMLDADLG